MWRSLLSSYWKYIAVGLVAVAFVMYVMGLRLQVAQLTNDKQVLENVIITQAALAEEARLENARKLAIFGRREKEIEVKWKTKQETVYVWEENNASCEDVIARFDRTLY